MRILVASFRSSNNDALMKMAYTRTRLPLPDQLGHVVIARVLVDTSLSAQGAGCVVLTE